MEKTIERKVINKAMKDFRSTKEFAKENGTKINSIFYTGERLTPTQVELIKEFIYGLASLNEEMGREITDVLISVIFAEAMEGLKIA